MSYVLERLFPYVLLLAVIFGIFIVMCALSIALLLYRSVPPVGAIGMGVAAAASSMVA